MKYGPCENGQSGLFSLFVKAVIEEEKFENCPRAFYKQSFPSLS